MAFDQIDYSGMPSDRDGAFLHIESQLWEAYEIDSANDRAKNSETDGNYTGQCDPERTYVSGVLATLEALNLEVELSDIADSKRHSPAAFRDEFQSFQQRVKRKVFEINIRKMREGSTSAGTAVIIESDFRDEIGKLLRKIRAIVNQEIEQGRKKDAIYKKIAALQSEVDRDQTTVDSLFRLGIDLTSAIGEGSTNLQPLVELLKNALWAGGRGVQALPDKGRPKLIEDRSDQENRTEETDDNIPF